MQDKQHYFYVLYCQDDTLYGGYTNDLAKRLKTHQSGKGAKYTRVKTRHPLQLIYAERWGSKSQAMRQEYWFKQLKRYDKERYLGQAGIATLPTTQCVIVNKLERTSGKDDGESGR
ncbi:GIY-YIG nuclease family protein [Tuanshanicoccus lijuaniae]|uniref:GIY-YIG nuclease family protein n=1 Tax=Aerococcaceae bacterium zg-1292 TaxID=2774330 RepID=UPI00385B788D